MVEFVALHWWLMCLGSVACSMIVEPEQRVADFAKAGSDIISVHAEQSSTIHLHRLINAVCGMIPHLCIQAYLSTLRGYLSSARFPCTARVP